MTHYGPGQVLCASAVMRSDRYNRWENILAYSSSCAEWLGAYRAVRRVPKHLESTVNLVFNISISLAWCEPNLGPRRHPSFG